MKGAFSLNNPLVGTVRHPLLTKGPLRSLGDLTDLIFEVHLHP